MKDNVQTYDNHMSHYMTFKGGILFNKDYTKL